METPSQPMVVVLGLALPLRPKIVMMRVIQWAMERMGVGSVLGSLEMAELASVTRLEMDCMTMGVLKESQRAASVSFLAFSRAVERGLEGEGWLLAGVLGGKFDINGLEEEICDLFFPAFGDVDEAFGDLYAVLP